MSRHKKRTIEEPLGYHKVPGTLSYTRDTKTNDFHSQAKHQRLYGELYAVEGFDLRDL